MSAPDRRTTRGDITQILEGLQTNTTLQSIHFRNISTLLLLEEGDQGPHAPQQQQQQQENANTAWLLSTAMPWVLLARTAERSGLIEIIFSFSVSVGKSEFLEKGAKRLFPLFQELGFDGMVAIEWGVFVSGVRFFKASHWATFKRNHLLLDTHKEEKEKEREKEIEQEKERKEEEEKKEKREEIEEIKEAEADKLDTVWAVYVHKLRIEEAAQQRGRHTSECYLPLLPRFANRRIQKKKDNIQKLRRSRTPKPSPLMSHLQDK